MGAALGCHALLDALELHVLPLLTKRQALKVSVVFLLMQACVLFNICTATVMHWSCCRLFEKTKTSNLSPAPHRVYTT